MCTTYCKCPGQLAHSTGRQQGSTVSAVLSAVGSCRTGLQRF